VLAPENRHMVLGTLALYAQRIGKVFASATTWAKLVRERGWMPSEGSGKHTHLNGGQGLANSATPGTYETGWDANWNSSPNLDPTKLKLNLLSCTLGVQPYNTWTNTAGAQENLPINCVSWYEADAFCIWDGGFLPARWDHAQE